jgi:CheY-like chemotaxis protein
MNDLRKSSKSLTLLMADDSEDDRLMARGAWSKSFVVSDVVSELHEVEDGEALMDGLHRRGDYSAEGHALRRALILLDLSRPRKNGHETLQEIEADLVLRRVPVVLTTSHAEADIVRSYNPGVNSFISKPVTFEGLVEAMKTLVKYWIEICAIPAIAEGA